MTLVSTATGVARSTIYRGLPELGEEPEPSDRVRSPGGCRKPAVEVQDGLEEALDALVEPAARGDPERPLRWVSKSLRHLADAKSLGDGVSVLRTQHGPGYRLYYATRGKRIIILLCRGDNGSQARDIRRARKPEREIDDENQ